MADSRWIAYELHDGLMQWVIGARMHLEALLADIKQRSLPSGCDGIEVQLAQILEHLAHASDEGRQLIRFVEGLSDLESTDAVETLEATCDHLVRKARNGRPQIHFRRPERAWPDLPQATAWAIVRIVQQAAMNAVQHADASELHIALDDDPANGLLRVSVVDDGCGFDPEVKVPGHFGLASMRQRAREAGFDLAISSHPNGGGTQLELRIPVPKGL